MNWKLWLDDQLDDSSLPARQVPDGFIGAKTVDEAKALVLQHGPPIFMDLDHDLGVGGETPEFLNWLFYEYGAVEPPSYRIHSENCVGRPNIDAFMSSWVRSLSLP